MPDWKDPQYLKTGSRRQQRAYAVLAELNIWSVLRCFDPVLAGTIPLGIDGPGSDLDLICEVSPEARPGFRELLQRQYGHLPSFRLRQHVIGGQESVVCNFRYGGEVLEIFGQGLPTARQNAYRHMLVEYAVLQAGGETWRRAVRQLKVQGLKTEPAFAQLLQLAGNPYEALLALEGRSAAELSAWIVSRGELPTSD
ncbi:DUF4269 domain-containing protein [Hymenobacter lucidus]|uniref:DUF4269 domain-containing protein n=1 Tax=Hymenobacter lucidus TaxID=2880930 RepID=A0ABS8AP21_9BACT|nr:DUF4269 domain-containing protein [Hymenobacter lucidus]MCB2407962.1 DUF4269 domain-containing protein [Hymenobacter lucidus]